VTQHQQTIFERIARLPRGVRWAIFAAVAMIVFLAWSDYIAPVSADWAVRAERIQRDVRTVHESSRLQSELRALRPTVVGVGPVQIPRDPAAGSDAMHRAVIEILAKHQVSGDTFSVNPRGAMGRSALASVLGGRQPHILQGNITFDATPDVALAVIAAIESSPHIESISQLTMQRIANRRVSVRMTLEAWIVGDEPLRGGAGASVAGREI
jgi:hypothetical protein